VKPKKMQNTTVWTIHRLSINCFTLRANSVQGGDPFLCGNGQTWRWMGCFWLLTPQIGWEISENHWKMDEDG